jgi:hypothetical protein
MAAEAARQNSYHRRTAANAANCCRRCVPRYAAEQALGSPLATFTVAGCGAAGVQPGAGARLWLPADLMYALRLAAGTAALVGWQSRSLARRSLCMCRWLQQQCLQQHVMPQIILELPLRMCFPPVQVGVADGGSRCGPAKAAAPTPLAKLFASKYQVAPAAGEGSEEEQTLQQQQQQRPGSLVAAAELWPAQGLPKGAAVPSPTLRHALAQPEPGASLLVYTIGERVPCSNSNSSVHQVYLRMCQRRSAAGDGAAAVLLLPPPGEGDAVPDGGLKADLGQAAVTQRLAAIGGGGPLSPAMRSRGGGTPAALSPAMRGGGGTPPTLLTPAAFRGSGIGRQSPATGVGGSGSRGRSGSATPRSSGRAPIAAPSTPSSARGAGGGGAGSADRNREQGRAKAEALLATLLTKGARVGRHAALPQSAANSIRGHGKVVLLSRRLHAAHTPPQTPALACGKWWRPCCYATWQAATCCPATWWRCPSSGSRPCSRWSM